MPPMNDGGMGQPQGDDAAFDDSDFEDFDGGNEQPQGGDDNSIDLSKYSDEDAKAIKKYAESFDDNNGGDEQQMPMESKRSRDSIINEIMNDVFRGENDEGDTIKRDERFIANNDVDYDSPFVSRR